MSNTRSEEFRVTNDNPTTCIRDKKDNTSVYLNLTTANFSGKIQVAIFGLCGDKKLNCTNKGLCFEVEAGKKYMLYNRVQEDHFPSAQLVFANLNGQTVEGTWSPDSKSESGCIELTDGLGLNSKNSDIVFQGPGTYCTEVRRKTSKSSVYFNLVDSKFSGTIDVSIYGISNDQEENCTNRRQSFSLSAGKKYELYNNVCEKNHGGCYLKIVVHQSQKVIGKWSPDYITESCVLLVTGKDENQSTSSSRLISHDLSGALKLIKVPYLNQLNIPSGCESVSATMLLQYYGVKISPEEFIKKHLNVHPWTVVNGRVYAADPNDAYVGDPYIRSGSNCGYGCYAPCIANAMNKNLPPLLRARSVTGKSLPDVVSEFIDKGKPVLIWATMNMSPMRLTTRWTINYPPEKKGNDFRWRGGEHCLVLVGYDQSNYIFNDPYQNNGVCKFPKSNVEECYNALGKQVVYVCDLNESFSKIKLADEDIQQMVLDSQNEIIQSIIPNIKLTHDTTYEIVFPGITIKVTAKHAIKSNFSKGPGCIEISQSKLNFPKYGFKLDFQGNSLKWNFGDTPNANFTLGPKWFNLNIDTKITNGNLSDILNKLTLIIGDGNIKTSYNFMKQTYTITIEKKFKFINSGEYIGVIDIEIHFEPQPPKSPQKAPAFNLTAEKGLILCGIGIGVVCVVGSFMANPAVGAFIGSAFAKGGISAVATGELLPAACTTALATFIGVTSNLFSGLNPF